MSPKHVFLLKQPAKNRGLELEDLKNGKIILDGIEFESFKEAEDHLINIDRIDI